MNLGHFPLCQVCLGGVCLFYLWISQHSEEIVYPIILYNYRERTNIVPTVTQSCSTLCGPMDCSTPGLPVHHQLPEFTQTHVHRLSDAIQPSHPLSSPSLPVFNLSQNQGLFSNESVLRIRWPIYWSFSFSISPSNEYSGLISWLIYLIMFTNNPSLDKRSLLEGRRLSRSDMEGHLLPK